MNTRFVAAAVAALALGLSATACGDDDKPATSSSSSSVVASDSSSSSSSVEEVTGNTYAIVPDAAVTAGFASINTAMDALAKAPATASDTTLDAVEELWGSFEGTVKKNEAASYLELEEALDAFFDAGKAKDGAAMTTAAADFRRAADAYLVKHP